MKIEVNIEKRYTYAIFGVLFLALGIFIVNAYGTSNPAVVGHSAGEIVEADPTVLASVKDGVSWSEISNIPAGFADGVDNTGGHGDGTNCPTGQYAKGVDENGNAQGCAVDNVGSSDCKSWTNPMRGGYYLYGYGDEKTIN